MIAALKIFFRSVGDIWFNLIGYATCNFVVAIGILLVLPGPPLMLALIQVTAESIPYAERPELGLLLQRAREHAIASWKLATVQLVVTLVIVVAFTFYYTLGTTWSVLLALLTASVGWTWLGVLLYSGALLLRSEGGTVMALRNALVAMLHHPFFTSTLVLLFLPFLVVSILAFPLLLLVTLSFYAILATRATNYVLQKEGLMSAPMTEAG